MRFLKTLTLAVAGLALSAQVATAADPLAGTFRFTQYGISLAGLPGQSTGPYEGSLNGGASVFDVYCIDALNLVAPLNTDFAVYRTRLDGATSLERTRLANLSPAYPLNLNVYGVAAYLANRMRLGDYADNAELAGIHLAMWCITSASCSGAHGQLVYGYTGSATLTAQFGGVGSPQYDWITPLNNAISSYGVTTANWRAADWLVISDARWTAQEPCGFPATPEAYADSQRCYQEVLQYDVIPEPATMGLMAFGLVGLGAAGIRRRRSV